VEKDSIIMGKEIVEVYELSDPSYVAYSEEFRQLLREFVDILKIPSITFESLHNYIGTIVDGIYKQKIAKVPDRAIQYKVYVGTVDNVLSGFTLFYMLPNRMPHVMTLDWPYIYSKNNKLTVAFVRELKKWKKIWRARHILMVANNRRISRVAGKLFKGNIGCGELLIAKDVKDEYLNMYALLDRRHIVNPNPKEETT
jgi:hypothetical protein